MPTGCWVAKAGERELVCFAFLSKPQDHFLARYPKNDRQGQGCQVPRITIANWLLWNERDREPHFLTGQFRGYI